MTMLKRVICNSFNTSNGRQAFAVIADIGPDKNRIDLSVALANLLGIQFDLKKGTSWTSQQVATVGGTSTSPALAVFGRALYMAWKGVEGDQRIFFSRFDGNSWAPQQGAARCAVQHLPSLAVLSIWPG